MTGSNKPASASVAVSRRAGGWGRWLFVALMVALAVLFANLGLWQLDRLAEKEAEIATVTARVNETPFAFPPVGHWHDVAPEALDYRPVVVEGRFDHDQTVLVFDNLSEARGTHSGVGYWVFAPIVTRDDGQEGIIWINRGFVPDTAAASFARGGMGPEGEVTVEGIARRPQRVNAFTPGADFAARREWVRNPERLTHFLNGWGGPVAPVTIDMAASEPGALPQGGETQLTFPNRHLEYAGTWFAFALVTIGMLGYWLWRQRRSANLAEPDDRN